MFRESNKFAGFAAFLTAASQIAILVTPQVANAKNGLNTDLADAAVANVPAALATGAPQLEAKPAVLTDQPVCPVALCTMRITSAQLLAAAENAIENRDFAAALPMVEALGLAPDFKFQHRFLKGFIAAETGDLATAEKAFRAILNDDPKQTRVRLELARIMMQKGKEGAANYHYRLAENDKDLPEDIRQTVSGLRGILRSKRAWNLNLDVGFAPDTNINSATSAETVNVNFGPIQLPLSLDENARKKSGIGQTAGLSAGMRIKASEKLAFIINSDARMINYDGKVADNFQLQLAAGPELRLSDSSSLSFQGVGEKRWYGGRSANTDFGAQVTFQKILSEGQRIGFAVDGRKTLSDFSDAYSGWQMGSNITYERIIGRSFIASASVFGRRDLLDSDAFSNLSYGATLGIGGELPLGLNAGVSGSISQAIFDAPQLVYSFDRRKDLRLFGRGYIGVRAFKLLGFSPSVEYNFAKSKSNYELYRSDRHRVNFKLARYF
jgi:outer membrane protein